MSMKKSHSGKYTAPCCGKPIADGGKVKHRTIANLSLFPRRSRPSDWPSSKGRSIAPGSLSQDVSLRQGLSVGGVWLVTNWPAVGSTGRWATRQGKLALWQVIARVIDQGSRLSAVRLAGTHAACECWDWGSSTKTTYA